MISNCKLFRTNRSISIFPVVAAKNYGRKVLLSSFIYVACLPVGRYWLWGKIPVGLMNTGCY
jgi:hypothetical protein